MTDWVGELHSLTTQDGNTLVLDGEVRFLTWGLYGAPPTNFQTSQGYKQHGVTELNYTLTPRRLSFELWNAPQTPRQAYWDMRSRLINFLRPNRGGPLTLTVLLPDGEKRSLVVRADPGLQFPPEGEKNNWGVQESLDFTAFDPIWFDPETDSFTPSASTDNSLVFPIDFPITFGTSGTQFDSGAFAYSGTWETFPRFTLTGPYNGAVIYHAGLEVTIYLSVPIGVGEQRILTLTPGAQSLVDGNGDNKFGELGPGSDLVNFRIAPEPEISGGINEIQVTFNGGVVGQSAVTIDFNTRYFGI